MKTSNDEWKMTTLRRRPSYLSFSRALLHVVVSPEVVEGQSSELTLPVWVEAQFDPPLLAQAAMLVVRVLVQSSPPAKRFHPLPLLHQPQIQHARLRVLVDAVGRALSCPLACSEPSESLPSPSL